MSTGSFSVLWREKAPDFYCLHRSIIINLCKAQFLATTVLVKPV